MMTFDIEKVKKVFDCDEDQYSEEFLLNTLKDYLEYFRYHNKNLTGKQYRLIHDCLELVSWIKSTEANESENI